MTCPTCGAFIVKEQMFNSKVKQAIFDYVRKRSGCTSKQIADYVYQDDINGGPDSVNVVAVHIAQMRPTLHQHGLDIRATLGHTSTYSLVRLKENAVDHQ